MSTKDRLREVLNYTADKCDTKNWRFEAEEKGKTIETYFGILTPLTLIEDLEDKKTFRHVYIKVPTADEILREYSTYMWDTEVYVYDTLVPMWRRVSNINIDDLIPQCYYADATPNNQILVLKNMTRQGFQNYKDRFLDFEHVVVSLKSLAQFHALSFITKKENVKLTTSLLKPYSDEFPPRLHEAILNCLKAHSQLFKGLKYERYWDEIIANYKTVANSTENAKFLLHGHGDFWKENVMFKYEGNKPVKACLLDFQCCRLMTPAEDFLFFILNSTNGSLRRQHYHTFLGEYFETFKKTLLENGIHLENCYTKESFISDLKTVASMCFVRICLAFSLWLGFESDSLVKSKSTWEDNQQRHKEVSCFKGILIYAMEDLCNYGYISL